MFTFGLNRGARSPERNDPKDLTLNAGLNRRIHLEPHGRLVRAIAAWTRAQGQPPIWRWLWRRAA